MFVWGIKSNVLIGAYFINALLIIPSNIMQQT